MDIQNLIVARTLDKTRRSAIDEAIGLLKLIKGATAQSRDYGPGIDKVVELIQSMEVEISWMNSSHSEGM